MSLQEREISQDQILRETSRVLRLMRPQRVIRRFFTDTGVAVAVLVGGGIWASGGFSEYSLGSLTVGLLGSLAIATGNRVIEMWSIRRLLRQTDRESSHHFRGDLNWLTGEGWIFRVAGAGAGMGLVIGAFSGVLAAIVEPELTFGGALRQTLAIGVPVMVALFVLLRVLLVARFERLLVDDPTTDLPN